jgi:hypothetical protein
VREKKTPSFHVREEKILYDVHGKKTHVLLPIEKYEELLERLADSEDLRAIRDVETEKTIPWREAKKKLQKKH